MKESKIKKKGNLLARKKMINKLVRGITALHIAFNFDTNTIFLAVPCQKNVYSGNGAVVWTLVHTRLYCLTKQVQFIFVRYNLGLL